MTTMVSPAWASTIKHTLSLRGLRNLRDERGVGAAAAQANAILTDCRILTVDEHYRLLFVPSAKTVSARSLDDKLDEATKMGLNGTPAGRGMVGPKLETPGRTATIDPKNIAGWIDTSRLASDNQWPGLLGKALAVITLNKLEASGTSPDPSTINRVTNKTQNAMQAALIACQAFVPQGVGRIILLRTPNGFDTIPG